LPAVPVPSHSFSSALPLTPSPLPPHPARTLARTCALAHSRTHTQPAHQKTTTWEGGVREPGIVRWKGTIAAGVTTAEVAATYDIMPTVAALAGVALAPDRAYDGKDLGPLLMSLGSATPAASPHDCVFHWKGASNLRCPEGMGGKCPGLWAARCGVYKMHYVTSNFTSSKVQTVHDPPLVFHLEQDPGENYPLDSASAEYAAARQLVQAGVDAHEASITQVPNQMGMGLNPDLKVCGCPTSQAAHPTLPNCTCNPDNWDPNLVACATGLPTWHGEIGADGSLLPSFATPYIDIEPLDAATWPTQPRIEFQEA